MNKVHNHNHGHNHCHLEHSNSRNLIIVLFITALYMIAEFLGGYYTKSLALTADAGHMLGDVASLALSLWALNLASKKAPISKTFGYYRVEILSAFVNGCTLVFIAFGIIYEAYLRLSFMQKIDALSMSVIAIGGLIVNVLAAFLLHRGSHENLNVKGAFFHVLGDLLGSIGAILAGLIIYFWHLYIADTIISVVIALLVLYSSFNLINSAVRVLMEAVPANVDINEINSAIKQVNGVLNIHDLHIWSINSANISLSVHVVADLKNSEQILSSINQILIENFNILHSTIQVEPNDFHENSCSINKSL